MYSSIEDFKKDWLLESRATLSIFNSLTDDSLQQKVYDEGRTLGTLAWHVTQTVAEMINAAGLIIENFEPDAPTPLLVSEIIAKYEYFSGKFLEKIIEWKDEELMEELKMYGETWKKTDVLKSLIFHQIHHRGQMTVLMRQAGLKVPGIYGPSKEEWQNFGMPPQE